jgi:integrase
MSWDQKLDYDAWSERFSKDLKRLEMEREYKDLKGLNTDRISRQVLYTSILFVQLKNGCRISEASEAVISFVQSGAREQRIRARKRKKLNKGKDAEVLIIIPKSIHRREKDLLVIGSQAQTINAVKCYARNHYHINTHSLRYAWIAKMGRENIPANLISKAIRHTNINTIMNYTQEDQADDIKRKFIESQK